MLLQGLTLGQVAEEMSFVGKDVTNQRSTEVLWWDTHEWRQVKKFSGSPKRRTARPPSRDPEGAGLRGPTYRLGGRNDESFGLNLAPFRAEQSSSHLAG